MLETGNSVRTFAQVVVGQQDGRASPTVRMTNALSPKKSSMFWISLNHYSERKSESLKWLCESR